MPTKPVRSLLVLSALTVAACGGADTLPLGTKASVEHVVEPTKSMTPSKLGLTVAAARKGTQAQLADAGFKLDGDETKATPYYLDLVYENQGTEPVRPLMSVSIEDGDANAVRSMTVIDLGGDPFTACPAADREATLAPGATMKDCEIFLVPPDFEPERVAFLPSGGTTETEWVYWELP